MSSDGRYIAAAVYSGHIYTSGDFGVTWVDRNSAPINGDMYWNSVAMTSDGRSLAAVENGGSMYMSSDHAATWKNKSSGVIANSRVWQTIAMTSDGKFLAAAVYGGHVYTSNNSGDFWEDKSSGQSQATSSGNPSLFLTMVDTSQCAAMTPLYTPMLRHDVRIDGSW